MALPPLSPKEKAVLLDELYALVDQTFTVVPPEDVAARQEVVVRAELAMLRAIYPDADVVIVLKPEGYAPLVVGNVARGESQTPYEGVYDFLRRVVASMAILLMESNKKAGTSRTN
jgi:hypothetical protein